MLTSKWIINRIGLVDFWYYDEEEFYFKNGRLLLRGANGSGKSVTMQSFIPLLLDGNKASERLDPFGTKARRLENYLLEEGDGREERTGYLYMEFKRQESDTFVTIGIGLNAKRGRKLDSWYFTINDGRRIGKDFFLYKDMKEKIALSRLELTNRIGDGGQVVNGQREYMKMVNDTLFGYESVEEYKELIDLLIQLRTPKLSKDFKPTVLNEILCNSLPPLSDEDLRPMSEAIENMDNLKARMDTLERSVKAAERILDVYSQYNRAVLTSKANWYLSATEKAGQLKKQGEQLEKQILTDELVRKEEEEREEALKQEQKQLELRRDNLAESDVNRLASKKVSLEYQVETLNHDLTEKRRQESGQEEREKELRYSIKNSEEKSEEQKQKISELLSKMESCFEVLDFDENTFLCDELSKEIEKEYSFDAIKLEVKKKKQQLEDGINCLRRYELIAQEYERKQVDLEKMNQELKNLEMNQDQYEEQVRQVKSEWQEHFYQWLKSNQQLLVSETIEQKMVQDMLGFTTESDFSIIKEPVRCMKEEQQKVFIQREASLSHEKNLLQEALEKKQEELQEWENKKDPEPERSEEVLRNRQWLRDQKIPFFSFYQAVDFVENIGEQQRNRLEEALCHMGVLDAVIVPSNYQNQVVVMREGMCDRYLFGEMSNIKHSMEQLLEVSAQTDDIIFYNELNRILTGMSTNEESSTWILENGVYGLGVVKGTITGEYHAKYIGVKARQEFRQQKIEELMKELMQAKAALEAKENELAEVLRRQAQLEQEYQNCPAADDIRLAVQELEVQETKVGFQREQIAQKVNERKQCYEQVKELGIQAAEFSHKLYLKAELKLFEAAKEEMEEYQGMVFEMENLHQKLLHQISLTTMDREQLDGVLEVLDGIRYDLGSFERKQSGMKKELADITEQLNMSGYEDIQAELLACAKRLELIPNELRECILKQSAAKKDYENHSLQMEEVQKKIERAERERLVTEHGFLLESDLGYVEDAIRLERETADSFAKRVYKVFSVNDGKTVNELASNFQEKFFGNNSELADFHVSQSKIFQQAENEETMELDYQFQRINVTAKYKGKEVPFQVLCKGLREDVEVQKQLVKESDRILFQDILANTISKKIRYKIYNSEKWVERMNELMNSMNTSSGLKLSLIWKKKKAEEENQLNTKELVELLKKDAGLMTEEELDQLSRHFQSKVEEARRMLADLGNIKSFHAIMREVLDYRKWFEFQLYYEKTGDKKKELTNNAFFTFSGGEKAMSMYVPLFSAVVAKYQGAKSDAPRLVSLDEAFAGVDEQNISDMFRLMVELDFEFIINSQILWGDCDTVPSLAIYQLLRKENAKYVTVLPYLWNGKKRILVTEENGMEDQLA